MSALAALQSIPTTTVKAAYVLVFGLAALITWGSLVRARAIEDVETRRGLVWLLATSGGWAAAHVGFLLAPTPQLQVAFYQLGLVIGIGAVGPWLYFCSAYTGRTLHRATAIRRLAVVVFLVLVAVKLTNPWHGLYFQSSPATTPFPHLVVEHQLLHWLAMGLAYALATVGYFMLLERFWQIGRSTLPLAVLAGLTGLPLLLDVIALRSDRLIALTYEPLGDVGFAVEDDGPGIPESERDEVFEFGYTTDESGTGFGLAIVREIASAHGWTVEVTDGAAGGARFEIAGVELVG